MQKINTVEMVRTIRDRQYDETKNMSHAELLKYYQENGEKALSELKNLAQSRHSTAQ